MDDVGLALLLLSMLLVSWLMLELFSGAAVGATAVGATGGAPLLLLSRETASNSWLVSGRFVVCKRESKGDVSGWFMGIILDECITGVYFPKIEFVNVIWKT